MHALCRGYRAEGLTIGFVPTMGYLHEGHLSLIELAKSRCDVTIVSVFVNPTQFAEGEDLETYPRDHDGDLKKIESAGGDIAFMPHIGEIYDGGPSVEISIPSLARRLCGQSRPEHFGGVCQVVLKLFGITACHVAVFGEKDYQQLTIIRRLVQDLFLDVEIIAGRIVREPDELAMSSRNVHLTAQHRAQALVLSQSIRHAQRRVSAGVTDVSVLKAQMLDMINEKADVHCDYIEFVDASTLEAIDTVVTTSPSRVLLAAKVGSVRLIDNGPLC